MAGEFYLLCLITTLGVVIFSEVFAAGSALWIIAECCADSFSRIVVVSLAAASSAVSYWASGGSSVRSCSSVTRHDIIRSDRRPLTDGYFGD